MSINVCGKRLQLVVKYPLSSGQPKYVFLEYYLLWAGLIDDVVRERDCFVASTRLAWFAK